VGTSEPSRVAASRWSSRCSGRSAVRTGESGDRSEQPARRINAAIKVLETTRVNLMAVLLFAGLLADLAEAECPQSSASNQYMRNCMGASVAHEERVQERGGAALLRA
jgi:hypothetical protein